MTTAPAGDPFDALGNPQPTPLGWSNLLTGRGGSKSDRQRFVLTQPVLDYSSLQPAAKARDFIHAIGNELPHVRVRITGAIAMSDEELETVSQGMGLSSGLSFIGFLMAGWTRHKQALHDKITNCYVVMSR